MLDKVLDNVTIVSINGIDPENSVKAINYSCKNIKFAEKLILTNRDIKFDGIKTINVGKLDNLQNYNLFCIKELHNYINTDFCLLIQPDGFVINHNFWNDDFLQYDYIGAPWTTSLSRDILHRCNLSSNDPNIMIVGNGGFSLRSKKILTEASKIDYDGLSLEEDCFISVFCRSKLKQFGIKYAPVELARQFSIESILDYNTIIGNSFGFHGKIFPYNQQFLNLI